MKYQTSHISNEELHRIWWDFHYLIDADIHIWESPPDLPQLCKQLDTNKKYLSQTINQATGLTIASLFHCYRLEHFIQKIRNGEAELITIEGLLNETGFQNRPSFYRSFKRFFGIPPKQMIQAIKIEPTY